MNRGNQRGAIFRSETDRACFLATLGETCERAGWRVHAYVLMGNHYHLLLETPEPNLVVGMQWLQATYSKRFNVANRTCGHLFQGRYKAVPIEPGNGYFSTVASYIHLNPARAKGWDFERNRLRDYRWSSYPAYLKRPLRSPWLCVVRVLGECGLADTPPGRQRYGQLLDGRVQEIRQADKPGEADGQWRQIRRGWYMGGEEFKTSLLDRLSTELAVDKPTPVRGEAIQEHNARAADRLARAGLQALGLEESDLATMQKGAPEKYALARLLRCSTSVQTGWIKRRLAMGAATNFAARIKEIERSRIGTASYQALSKLKNIKI